MDTIQLSVAIYFIPLIIIDSIQTFMLIVFWLILKFHLRIDHNYKRKEN